MKIALLSEQDRFAEEMLKGLRAEPGHKFFAWPQGEAAPAKDLDVLLVMGKAGAEELAGQTKLGLLQTASAGYDGIDVEAATAAGVWVSYAPSEKTGNGASVAEFAVLLLLAASRRLRQALAFERDRSAEKPELGAALSGKTVCIVGMGGIGELIVERLRPFGMTLTAVDAHPDNSLEGVKTYPMENLKDALGEADYTVVSIRGTSENENMFDAEVFAAMKKGSVLVNVARGSLIDEEALLAAVKSGQVGAAGLDVLKHEPTDPHDPLMALSQVFITPHIAGPTDLMLAGTVKYIGEVLKLYEAGKKPDSVVNSPEKPWKVLQ